jgi:hypothetical protein
MCCNPMLIIEHRQQDFHSAIGSESIQLGPIELIAKQRLRHCLIWARRQSPDHGWQDQLAVPEVASHAVNAVASWAAHSYRLKCRDVGVGTGAAGAASRSEVDEAAHRVLAWVSLWSLVRHFA